MAKQILNTGVSNNDKTGDTLRAGGLKIKANFDEIYNALGNGTNITGGNLLKTGSWSDVQNKPEFATVATSGSYDDLTDTPAVFIEAGVPETLNGSTGDVHSMIAYDGTNLYVCTETYTDGVAEIWKTIPWDGGTANTGDITFNGVKVIGAGTASGDGYGYSTIELVPDSDLYIINSTGAFGTGGQYLIIDPTSPNHIHIRAGGPQDQAAAQLILGGEKANVTVRDQDNSFTENHEVLINTQSNDGSAINLWQFKGNADLELPTNGGIVFDRADTTIRVGMGFHIASGEGISLDAIDLTDPESPAYKSWYFSPAGEMYFPDGRIQETAWTGGRVVTVPTHSTGASGDLEGDLAFSDEYIYYCIADYASGGNIWKRVAWSNDTW